MPAQKNLKLKLAICDDNIAFMQQLRAKLDAMLAGKPHQIQCFAAPEELLRAAESEPFTIAVLDIVLPGQNGINLAASLLERCPHCQIIFLTGYITYAQDVYDVEHVAFVMKSEVDKRLPAVLERLQRRLQNRQAMLVLDACGTAQLVPQQEIIYIERRVRTTILYCRGKNLTTAEKLEPLLKRLDGELFCQCHKSFVIYWPACRRYGKEELELDGGVHIPISRRYSNEVRCAFLHYIETLREPEGPQEPETQAAIPGAPVDDGQDTE